MNPAEEDQIDISNYNKDNLEEHPDVANFIDKFNHNEFTDKDTIIKAYLIRDYVFYSELSTKEIIKKYIKNMKYLSLDVLNYADSEEPSLESFYQKLTIDELIQIGW